MKVFRYPLRSLVGDYIRAFVGVAVGLGVLVSVPVSWVIALVFGSITLLFLTFGAWTVNRHLVQVAVTNDQIGCRGFGTKSLSWDELSRIKLRYYGVRRQTKASGSGFMQLTLRGGRTKLTFESSLDGFDFIAWRAAKAMRDNAAQVDPTSAGNLLALGIDADGEGPPPDDYVYFAGRGDQS